MTASPTMSASGPSAPGAPVARHLPAADAASAEFAGVAFRAVAEAPALPGLFILTRRIGALAYPIYMGEGEDMAAALAAVRAELPDETALADGLFVMERSNARLRTHTLRDLVGKFDPPLNTADRKGPAAAEIAALVPDRAEASFAGAREQLAAEIHVTEADLERLVKEFYAAAGADAVLGPVFARAIPDWEEHFQVVQDFWSRSLLGTSRYSGNPFSAHIALKLTPEHFTRWVGLFTQTARRVLEPVAADRAIAKVEHMSACFQAGLVPPSLDAPAHGHGAPHGSAGGHPGA